MLKIVFLIQPSLQSVTGLNPSAAVGLVKIKSAFRAFLESFLLSVYGLTYIFYYLWAVARERERETGVYPELLMR